MLGEIERSYKTIKQSKNLAMWLDIVGSDFVPQLERQNPIARRWFDMRLRRRCPFAIHFQYLKYISISVRQVRSVRFKTNLAERCRLRFYSSCCVELCCSKNLPLYVPYKNAWNITKTKWTSSIRRDAWLWQVNGTHRHALENFYNQLN